MLIRVAFVIGSHVDQGDKCTRVMVMKITCVLGSRVDQVEVY